MLKLRNFSKSARIFFLALLSLAGGLTKAEAAAKSHWFFTAAARDSAAKPAGAAPVSAAGGGGHQRNVGAGIGVCNLQTGDINLGKLAAASYNPIDVVSKMHVGCVGLTTSTQFCFMVYPANGSEHPGLRTLWKNGKVGDPNYANFQFVTNNITWGAGQDQGDYGTPYFNDSGIYIGAGWDLSFDAYVGLGQNVGQNLEPATYSNDYIVQMVYTNTPTCGTEEILCKKKPGRLGCQIGFPFTMNQTKRTVHITAQIIPACGIETSGALSFGTQFHADVKLTSSSADVRVKCSGGMKYTVAADAGRNADSVGTNAMKCQTPASCGGDLVQYLIYDSSRNIWNSRRENPYIQAGQRDTAGEDIYTLHAETIPTKALVRPGNYRDTVVFTLTAAAP